MRFSNPVKISVILLIILLSLGIAWFAVFSPMLDEFNKIENDITNKKTEIAAAQVIISENMQLRSSYSEALQKAIEAQKIFYPEMSAIQTIDEVNKILNSSELKSESGITVSRISSSALSITLSSVEESINYEVREHSFLNDNSVVESEQSSSETDLTRRDLFALLETAEINSTEKSEVIAVLREALAKESIEIGRITVNLSLDLSYSEYIEFLNMIENYDKAISIQTARFRGDNLSHDAKEKYDVELYLYVIKPIDEL